jgi:hypothetical protein
MGPLKKWPEGHLIMALSSGPSVEFMMNRHLTSAGSAHLTASSSSRYAGQSRNMIWWLITSPSVVLPGRSELAGHGRGAAVSRRDG